jgi:hypothetical protein
MIWAWHTLGGGEVDDVAVALEHVDLLNGLDGLDVQLLEGLLELLVVTAGAVRCALDLSPRGTLATTLSNSTSEIRSNEQSTASVRQPVGFVVALWKYIP